MRWPAIYGFRAAVSTTLEVSLTLEVGRLDLLGRDYRDEHHEQRVARPVLCDLVVHIKPMPNLDAYLLRRYIVWVSRHALESARSRTECHS